MFIVSFLSLSLSSPPQRTIVHLLSLYALHYTKPDLMEPAKFFLLKEPKLFIGPPATALRLT